MTNPFPTIGRIRAGILFNASSGAKDNNKATINENPTTSPPSKPSTAFSRIIICIPADNCEAIRLLEKIRKNGEKYPVEKAKGTAKKYTEL